VHPAANIAPFSGPQYAAKTSGARGYTVDERCQRDVVGSADRPAVRKGVSHKARARRQGPTPWKMDKPKSRNAVNGPFAGHPKEACLSRRGAELVVAGHLLIDLAALVLFA